MSRADLYTSSSLSERVLRRRPLAAQAQVAYSAGDPMHHRPPAATNQHTLSSPARKSSNPPWWNRRTRLERILCVFVFLALVLSLALVSLLAAVSMGQLTTCKYI